MTQDKAPEQVCLALMANPPVERTQDEGPPVVVVRDYSDAVEAIMLIVNQAYERGQVDMRERVQALLVQTSPHSPRRYIYDKDFERREWACDKLDAAIRSLPIAGKDA